MTMSDTMTKPNPDVIPRPRKQWRRAFTALRRLLSDKEDTGQVFEIMRALNGGTEERNYKRLLRTLSGGRLAYERVEMAPKLMDDAWLDSFAPGTVGAAYRTFVRSENISAKGLVDLSRQRATIVDAPHPHAWIGRRTRDVHDIWHVLTGYHRDGLGEACLVAFTYAQTRGLGWAFIAMGALFRARAHPEQPGVAAIRQGYRRGKSAKWLLGEDYVALMNEPLEAARYRLNLTPPTIYNSIPSGERDRASQLAAQPA